jgi:hypothetical protein
MSVNDMLDMRDPQMIAEYAQEVYLSMIEKENFDCYRIDH